MNFYTLKVEKKVIESQEAVSIYLEIPKEYTEQFQFNAGQYITIRQDIDGHEIRRSYSISSRWNDDTFAFTVKKVADGKLSNFLVHELTVGQLLECSGPDGRFVIKPVHENRRNYYFFAAGSGITPVFSMIQTLIEYEPKSVVHLLYGNRTDEDIIFKNGLDQLRLTYEGQLHIIHCISTSKAGLLKNIFQKNNLDEDKWPGRIDTSKIEKFLQRFPSGILPAYFYICGPGTFIKNTEDSLLAQGILPTQIHKEYFTPAASTKPSLTSLSGHSHIVVHLNGKSHNLDISKGELILEKLIDLNLDPPYSCSSGVCSTCMAKLIKGEVRMDVSTALDPEEIEAGYILTCQSRPVTDELEIEYL